MTNLNIQVLWDKTWSLYAKAPEPAQVSASVALVIGATGVACFLLVFLSSIRDRRALALARVTGTIVAPPRWSLLDHTVGGLYVDGQLQVRLSPDAAMSYLQSRMDMWQSTISGLMRFSSYGPLLIGLMGTMLGLADMLHDAQAGQTHTLVLKDLDGVFVGTLFGILGSLIGTLAMILASAITSTVVAAVENYAHHYILPLIQMPALLVRIEDVVEPVREKVREALEPFVEEVLALGQLLKEHAEASRQAAVDTSEALVRARAAAEKATVFDEASGAFRDSAKKVAEAGNTLADLTKSSQELATRATDLGEKLLGANRATEDLTRNATVVSGKMIDASTQMSASANAMVGQTSSMGVSADRLADICKQLVDTQDRVRAEVVAVQNMMDQLAPNAASMISDGFKERFEAICRALNDTITGVKAPLDGAAAMLREEQRRLVESAEQANLLLPQVSDRIHAMAQEVAKLVSATELLAKMRAQGAASDEQVRLPDGNNAQEIVAPIVQELDIQLSVINQIRDILDKRIKKPKPKRRLILGLLPTRRREES